MCYEKRKLYYSVSTRCISVKSLMRGRSKFLTKTKCMKARIFLFTVIASLMMVSCTKYYRVVEDDTPIYDELDEGSEVLATLKAGEVV